MDDFIAIFSPAEPLDTEAVRRLARHGCLDIHRVNWIRSYLAPDGERMLCWYQAHDAESVRLVVRHQGYTDTPIWATTVTGPTGPGRLEAVRSCLIIELSLDVEGPEGGASTEPGRLAAVLAGPDRCLVAAFRSPQADRAIAIVEGLKADNAGDLLLSAGIEPILIWEALELDPQPPELFSSQMTTSRTSVPIEPGPTVGAPAPIAGRNDIPGAGATDALDALIVGAGLSGICTLHHLIDMGLRVRVYESGSDVGGVWYWNRYPGARVDSEVYTYGFAFSEELIREWNWQELFAAQPEIWRYLDYVVDRFNLRRHMRFDEPIIAARYQESGGYWLVDTANGERVAARYLIAASGSLTAPQLPDYPGMETFSGESYHTARWPASGVDLAGRRVGIIGTGASGVQVIQTIAGAVRQLNVFQRTPTYCIPQRNRILSDNDRELIRRDWENILSRCRDSFGGFIHTFDPRSGLAVSDDERQAKFEELWEIPGFAFWFGNFADLMMNSEVNADASEFVRRKIRERVKDPETARKLLPDHPFGTKRVPLENGYYEVYNRRNVRLVDLRETPIQRITPEGIQTSNEKYPLDVLILATGFDAGTGALTRIDIRGRGGISLAGKWRGGPRTFLGLLVSGFPNLFIVNGPHNAAALCNAGRCIEQNVRWIARCIEHMRARNLTLVEASGEAEDEWTEHVYDSADATVLSLMRDSWFFGANTPGKSRRVTIYAAGARQFREHCEGVEAAGYTGLTMS